MHNPLSPKQNSTKTKQSFGFAVGEKKVKEQQESERSHDSISDELVMNEGYDRELVQEDVQKSGENTEGAKEIDSAEAVIVEMEDMPLEFPEDASEASSETFLKHEKVVEENYVMSDVGVQNSLHSKEELVRIVDSVPATQSSERKKTKSRGMDMRRSTASRQRSAGKSQAVDLKPVKTPVAPVVASGPRMGDVKAISKKQPTPAAEIKKNDTNNAPQQSSVQDVPAPRMRHREANLKKVAHNDAKQTLLIAKKERAENVSEKNVKTTEVRTESAQTKKTPSKIVDTPTSAPKILKKIVDASAKTKKDISPQEVKKVTEIDSKCQSDSFFAQREEMREIEVVNGLQMKAPATSRIGSSLYKKRPDLSISTLIATRSLSDKKKKHLFHTLVLMIGFSSMMSTFLFVGNALAIKERSLVRAEQAIGELKGAASFASMGEFARMGGEMQNAYTLFKDVQKDLDQINELVISIARFVPGASQVATGDALVDASVALTASGQGAANHMVWVEEYILNRPEGEALPILELIQRTYDELEEISEAIATADRSLARVALEDVPEGQRGQILRAQKLIPVMRESIEQALMLRSAIEDIFGVNGPRTYLFLFQNNHEMRASGGFIGSYGFLDIAQGHIREFKIDGIYNPNGQLTDKVVPPRPIQKISEAWGMHDSNWWPDFSVSAEKAIEFYGRTGGPSVDGVIAMTPTIVERLLRITGPITLPEYDVTLTSDNFIPMTQFEVEVDYDKEENRPKKILSDLMPVLLGKLQENMSEEALYGLIDLAYDSLEQRHLMIYSRNQDVQSLLEERHWAGRILETEGNYVSVIHSNINGFKTDGVIDQKITHHIDIQEDGRSLNTLTVERSHTGGDTGYKWWDAVNANYMRVYVPQGAKLLSVEGHTREWHPPRLNYHELGYEIDPRIADEEDDAIVHKESGTRIFEDSGKTVFGNWVYVSPGETVRVVYVYELDQMLLRDDASRDVMTYSALYQKQAGDQGTTLERSVSLPQGYQVKASVPQSFEEGETKEKFEKDLYYSIILEPL